MQAARLAEDVGADEIIVEANMGGEMVEQTLKTGGVVIPVRRVHARLSKRARAAPVAALYEAGRVSHIGRLDALEDEMCRFGAEGFSGSPDRVDALVWGLSALMLRGTARPRVRVI
jgi:phage terminase large subunit-like protein